MGQIAADENAALIRLRRDPRTQFPLETSGTSDDQSGGGKPRSQRIERSDLEKKVVLGFQLSDRHDERVMIPDELVEYAGIFGVGRPGRKRERGYQTNPLAGDIESPKKIHEFRVDADDTVKPAQHKASEARSVHGTTGAGGRIPARVEREYGLHPGKQRAEEAQRQKTTFQLSADVQVNYIVAAANQETGDLHRICRVVDSVAIRPSKPGEIDDVAMHIPSAKVVTDSNQVGLHAAVRRWIRTE